MAPTWAWLQSGFRSGYLAMERAPAGRDTDADPHGSSIVAVLRGANAIPSPGPDFRLAAGDTLIVIGT